MKYLHLLFTMLSAIAGFSQNPIPHFLEGTWQTEGKDVFERWDKLNENKLAGISYQLKDGQPVITEYLEISRQNKTTTYYATVLGQNGGKAVAFKLTVSDSTYTFENLRHDFPKRIVYQKLGTNEVSVQLSDAAQKSGTYKMIRVGESSPESSQSASNPNYDLSLAQKLKADDYGMKSYILVILKTGTNTTTDKQLVNDLFKGHMQNIQQLVDEGKLIVAGPLGKNAKNYRGIFILNNIESTEEAEKLLQTDPAIREKLLDVEIFKWYGSAALPEYLPASDKIWKSKP